MKQYADDIIKFVSGKSASITMAKTEQRHESSPLPYDLLELQADASRKFNIKPDRTLKLTQRLREKKLITYNRSDCRYLNEEQHEDAPLVLMAISENASILAGACATAQPSIKSRCFNNDNVTAHHAIIPTEGRFCIDDLSENERQIYLLIARQYIAQFWQQKVSKTTEVVVDVEGHVFKARSTEIIEAGWSRLYKHDKGNDEVYQVKDEDEIDVSLNSLFKGNIGKCESAKCDKKATKPPKHYTQSTLLKDLKRVAKYVADPNIAALLRDKDKEKKGEQGGIGTPATRDTFVVKLIERGYVQEQGKNIVSTALGQSFHDSLPLFATQPDLTALWHAQQKEIELGKQKTLVFFNELISTVQAHVEVVKSGGLNIKADTRDCPHCEKGLLIKRKGKYGDFWPCNNYPECEASFLDKAGQPDFTIKPPFEVSDHQCETCGQPLIRRKSKSKGRKNKVAYWYGCSAFPDCKTTYFEKNGQPDFQGKKEINES